MSLSLYQASVPTLIRMLANLKAILAKGAAHAQSAKFDPAVLVNARLFPDMFALARQVQLAADMAKACGARLAGLEPPRYEDTETTFAELGARIDKTIGFLQTLSATQIDGAEERPITLTLRSGTLSFTGQAYLVSFVLPNFYFHLATAYNILRHNGVPLGKADFLGPGP